MHKEKVYFAHVPSPVGPFLVAGSDQALHFTSFSSGHQQRAPQSHWKKDQGALAYALPQFHAYFEGQAVTFDIALQPNGTEFQCAVWRALQQIPHGVTWSYSDVARHLGNPGAARAVGAANAANHLPIVIPCHRVIGADKTLTGFGGGLDTKAILLKLEGICLNDADAQLTLL